MHQSFAIMFAHAGHGDARWQVTLTHYVLEPEHAWIVWLILAVVIVAGVVVRRRAQRSR